MKNPLDTVLVRTADRQRAERSRWRWMDDGSGVYKLRLRGLVSLRLLLWVQR